MTMDDIFTTLAHPKRRTLLLDLFYEREGTITHFKKDLKMKTATLYHHLNILLKNGLIEQTEARSYRLTPKGLNSIKPLFSDRPAEFDKMKNNLYGEILNQQNSPISNQNNMISIYKHIDSFLSFLFLKERFVLIAVIVQYLLLVFILEFMGLILVGNHLIISEDFLISLFVLIITIFLTFGMVWFYPRAVNKQEPFSMDLFLLSSLLFFPITIEGIFLYFLKVIGSVNLITEGLILVFDFLNQFFWLFWVYIIFRRINGMEYYQALLGTFIINYFWLTIALLSRI